MSWHLNNYFQKIIRRCRRLQNFKNQTREKFSTPAVSLLLFSDGTLRCYSVNLLCTSMSKCFTSSINCHSMYSTFELIEQFVFLISTCGQLHCCALDLNSMDSAFSSTSSTPHYKSIYQIKVENAGLSALAFTMFGNDNNRKQDDITGFIGSESGKITAVKFDSKDIQVVDSCYAHSSTVTDVKIIPFYSTCEILSIALDCRISIIKYCLTKRKLTQKRILLLNLADPSSLLCWPKTENMTSKHEILCLVAGSGLESMEIKNQ